MWGWGVGASITENLVRSRFGKLKGIDRDRIEERNLSTQPYYKSDIDAPFRNKDKVFFGYQLGMKRLQIIWILFKFT